MVARKLSAGGLVVGVGAAAHAGEHARVAHHNHRRPSPSHRAIGGLPPITRAPARKSRLAVHTSLAATGGLLGHTRFHLRPLGALPVQPRSRLIRTEDEAAWTRRGLIDSVSCTFECSSTRRPGTPGICHLASSPPANRSPRIGRS